MFRVLASFILVACFIGSASAQEPTSNRGVRDIRLVHPPGTPPGTWRVTTYLDLAATDAAPQPASVSSDLTLLVNGAPVAFESFDAGPTSVPYPCEVLCQQSGCALWYFVSPHINLAVDAYCYHIPNQSWGCKCGLHLFPGWQTDLVLQPSDVVTVTIAARAGSLPETYLGDDSYTIQVWEQAPGVAECFGDGSGTACPCGNAGAAGNGCASSVDAAGANLIATGNGSVSADSVVLAGTGMPNSSCLYFQGTSAVNGGAGSVFGDGLRCAGGAVIRLGTKLNAAGASQYPASGDLAISLKGAVPAVGGSRVYQAWYRNAAPFCTVSTFNLTNAVGIAWQP